MKKKVLNVLVLEDSRSDFRLLKEFFSEAEQSGAASFRLMNAEYLSKALDLLSGSSFDIILSDLFVPDSSGLDTFFTLWERSPDTPIVVMTGFENEDVATKAVNSGAQDYLLKKNINSEELARIVRYSIERKKVENSLRSSELRYRALIDSLDDAVVVLEPDYRISMMNPVFSDLMGRLGPAAAEPGNDIRNFRNAMPPAFFQALNEVFSAGKSVTLEDFCRSGEEKFSLEIKGIPVLIGEELRRALVIIRDITERKQIEAMKDEFASLVSHELRSPLTTVTSGMSMVLDGVLGEIGPEVKQVLSVSYEESKRLNRIISKLLEICRLEKGKTKFKKEPVDLVEMGKAMVDRFAGQTAGREIKIKGNFPRGRLVVSADPDGLSEVFSNLFTNALKFTEKGMVEFSVRDLGKEAECVVKDTGRGVSKEDQPKLFSKFRQFGGPVPGQDRGTGLGLFIVKEIVNLHGGNISVYSEPGKGTSFVIRLPKGEPPSQAGGSENLKNGVKISI